MPDQPHVRDGLLEGLVAHLVAIDCHCILPLDVLLPTAYILLVMRLVKPSSQSPRIGVDARMTAHEDQALTLESLSVDALPLVNHFLTRLGFDRLLEAHVPAVDRRYRLHPARTLGVLLRNLMLARVPLYSQQEWARCQVGTVECLAENSLAACSR